MILDYELLNWDSQFFGFKVARIINPNIDSKQIINNTLSALSKDKVKLIYIVLDEQNLKANLLLSEFNRPITTNVTFKLKISETPIESFEGVEHYQNDKIEDELFDLAIQAGHDSRYKLDLDFEQGEFERLYRLWIENSVNKTIADFVFVYRNAGKVKGFVTLKINNDSGVIGLIAVDETTRGLGIGKKLVYKVFQTLAELNVEHCFVATQKDNLGAVKFYESLGFSVLKSEVYYHIWL